MPKGPDALGIHFEGSVLTGEKSVQQQQRDEAIRAFNGAGEPYPGIDPAGQAIKFYLGSRKTSRR